MKPRKPEKSAVAKMRRRSFLKGALTIGAASFFLPRISLADPASDKVNLACYGIGGRGPDVIKELHKTGLV